MIYIYDVNHDKQFQLTAMRLYVSCAIMLRMYEDKKVFRNLLIHIEKGLIIHEANRKLYD